MADEPATPARNVALLIDADNASPDSLDPVLTVLASFGTVNIRRAYGNWKKPALNRNSGEDHPSPAGSSPSSSSTSPRARAPPT